MESQGWAEVDEETANTFKTQASVNAEAYHSTDVVDDKAGRWVADSGSNWHVTNDAADFNKGTVRSVQVVVGVGNGVVLAKQEGDVMVCDGGTGCTISLKKVLLMPMCAQKLISEPLLDHAQCPCTLR